MPQPAIFVPLRPDWVGRYRLRPHVSVPLECARWLRHGRAYNAVLVSRPRFARTPLLRRVRTLQSAGATVALVDDALDGAPDGYAVFALRDVEAAP